MNGIGDVVRPPTDTGTLVQLGMETLFEDQKFSGDLMAKLYRLGMSEQEMDAIFKRAENDIIGYVSGLQDGDNPDQAARDLATFVNLLKRRILKNPVSFASRA